MALVSPAQEESRTTAVPPMKRQETEPSDRLEDVVELDDNFFTDLFSALPPQVLRGRRPTRPTKGIGGSVRRKVITDKNRGFLVSLCNLALDKYNAENQSTKFEFVELSLFESGPGNGMRYFIKFQAKDVADPSNSTGGPCYFFTKLWHIMRNNEPPKVTPSNSTGATCYFFTKVWHTRRNKEPPKVTFCRKMTTPHDSYPAVYY